jgi:hypothetical protein
MDFIVELPLLNGFNTIYVCVDLFTKMAHLCPTTIQVTAEETAHSTRHVKRITTTIITTATHAKAVRIHNHKQSSLYTA